MADLALTQYIKQNLEAGFSEEEIKQALRQVGWREMEIEEGFVTAKHFALQSSQKSAAEELAEKQSFLSRRGLIIILVILIALPILVYGGFLGYQKIKDYQASKNNQPPPQDQSLKANLESVAALEAKQKQEAMEKRDQQRLQDIEAIQTALQNYFTANQFYPKNLNALLEQKILTKLPLDPETQIPYLYTSFEDPALHYSLSFILETDAGPLKQGLQVVSSEIALPASVIQTLNDLVKGKATQSITGKLVITDLSKKPFYPAEEITLQITHPPSIELASAYLVMDNLDLVDRQSPFGFRFSAPSNSGIYLVQIFAFDKNGVGYSEKTTLTVATKP